MKQLKLMLMVVSVWGIVGMAQEKTHALLPDKNNSNQYTEKRKSEMFRASSPYDRDSLFHTEPLFRPDYVSDQIFASSIDGFNIFDAVTDYEIGGGPSSLGAGDFNGDGQIDLVVSGGGADSVNIFLCNGNGTFTEKGAISYGGPGGVSSGDFNNDRKLDVAVVAKESVFIAIGNGDGSFQNPIGTYSDPIQGLGRVAIVTSDFNKDGKLDIAVPAGSDSTAGVDVLIGNGDGTLQTPIRYTVGTVNALALGDFNKDGNIDIAVPACGILFGKGDGSFVGLKIMETSIESDILAADFNSDGNMDLVTIRFGYTKGINVYMGNGDGTFQSSRNFSGSTNDRSVTVADFNGDGNVDIAVPGCWILLGRGDGSFQPAVHYYASDGYEQGIITGDFNGDHKIDLAAGTRKHRSRGFFSILINKGDGTFCQLQPLNLNEISDDIVSYDINNDASADLLTANYRNTSITTLTGNGDGTFQQAVTYFVGGNAASIIAADFNGDGIRDLAVAFEYINGGGISVFVGNNNGTFQPAVVYPTSNSVSSITSGDFNTDGYIDLAANSIGSILIYRNQGNGAFQLVGTLSDDVGWAYTTYKRRYLNWITCGDFNKDGKIDLAATDYVKGHGVSVFLGNGDLTFQPKIKYTSGGYPGYIYACDFNEDGILDLATADAGTDDISIFIGKSDGTFKSCVQYAPGSIPTSLAIGDINGDGHFDIVAANIYSSNITILFGRGDGTFSNIIHYKTEWSNGVAVGDFDKNGALDIAVAGERVGLLMSKLTGPLSVGFVHPISTTFSLGQNYPNPFNAATTIEFSLAADSKVSFKIYNILGQEVATLIKQEMKAGVLHRVAFDAAKFSSGIYFYRLEAGPYTETKRFVLLR